MTISHAADLQHALTKRREDLVAAAIGRYENGALSYATVGHPRIDAEGEADLNTRFKWGSVTKIVTAFLVCQLADEGRLNLDDPIDAHLPGYSAAIGDNRATTIRHLLSHQAGLVDLFERFENADGITSKLASEGLIAPAGALFSYTNAGYALLGALVEQVTGRTWRDCVRNRILDPIGARTATFALEENDTNAARDYVFVEGAATAAPLWPDAGPYLEAAGSSFASGIGDAVRILASLMSGRDIAKTDGPVWMSPAMLEEMQKVQARLPAPSLIAKAWGLGWSVDPELNTVAHMGGTSALALGVPRRRRLCVFLSNTPNGAEVAQTELRPLLGLPPKAVLPRVAGADMRSVVGQYASPLFKFDVVEEDGRLYASSSFIPNRIELQPVGPRTYIARIDSGREGVETEVNFLGDGSPPTHMHIALRALRRV
jgi:CubicO group peptidase (beta-lactamase class C family)